ncbi:TPA: DUF1642 domain-containing protein [Streptococcus agalactiae]|uniref:DUF1642 domain-containing protein n=1 Tax=Streptococcus agalactiae TaxID=1311 RepID=UPI000DF8D6BA|nr:DUF1642 domain-containing protein [Streptococcus agalactiae]SUN02000.1 Protein of uncharacterised function (DUF1642) [Streptococcus agalactiae]SUN03050.1 Protein of uncharacterised function (DUF1642) [Streptococcus agalactiae]HEN8903927.1 DUF1642 domain-containing protein [Streptococcus agalactiae]HEO1217482.1 DUF1642 domain-containing protein [Streptococcus agalactiae]HEO2392659.1 DUF1642 domain-containing protein [Streptococcus agalactiae]
MNIEEAKKIVDKLSVDSDELWKIPMIPAHKVKALLDTLDQPKPKVPQFVADWYEKHKDSLEYCIWEYITEWDNQEKDDFFDFMNYSTFKPIQTLVNMHQFGYTVEKEKLYTVEIPNPNERQLSFVLMRQLSGNVSIKVMHRDNLDLLKTDNDLQLTESEIRKDFDWAWQFREEVVE